MVLPYENQEETQIKPEIAPEALRDKLVADRIVAIQTLQAIQPEIIGLNYFANAAIAELRLFPSGAEKDSNTQAISPTFDDIKRTIGILTVAPAFMPLSKEGSIGHEELMTLLKKKEEILREVKAIQETEDAETALRKFLVPEPSSRSNVAEESAGIITEKDWQKAVMTLQKEKSVHSRISIAASLKLLAPRRFAETVDVESLASEVPEEIELAKRNGQVLRVLAHCIQVFGDKTWEWMSKKEASKYIKRDFSLMKTEYAGYFLLNNIYLLALIDRSQLKNFGIDDNPANPVLKPFVDKLLNRTVEGHPLRSEEVGEMGKLIVINPALKSSFPVLSQDAVESLIHQVHSLGQSIGYDEMKYEYAALLKYLLKEPYFAGQKIEFQ